MTKELFCIKLGGSIITDKQIPYTAKRERIQAIAKTLRKIKTPLLISHGVGSFAHISAAQYGGKKGYKNTWGIAKVCLDAMLINSILMEIFLGERLPAISFGPRSFLLTKNGKLHAFFFDPILEALSQGLIPVIYGDVIWDREQKTTIFSGETTLSILCQDLQKKSYTIPKVVQLSNVDGVLDNTKKIIPEITPQNWQKVKGVLRQGETIDVTGGMKHKVENAIKLTEFGIQTIIANGNNTSQLNKIIKGEKIGTVIVK